MRYNIAIIADIHWDAMEPKKQYAELRFFNEFVSRVSLLDLVVIAGDIFDTKILLNSQTSLLCIKWMDELVSICKRRNIPIRIIKGTNSHDNNQLDAFDHYARDLDFKIFRNCAEEETLPGFDCIYCPDELMSFPEYLEKYRDIIYSAVHDAMFFHGSFDVVLPEVSVQESESEGSMRLVFPYKLFESTCRVMLGGHWHDGSDAEGDHMYYARSFSRWSFGEENPKGFIYLNYDTEDHSYLVQRIENPCADIYKTYSIFTSEMRKVEDYTPYIKLVEDDLKEQRVKVRIKIIMNDKKESDENGIDMMKSYFLNRNRRVKIVVKNNLREKTAKEDAKKTEEIRNRFSFISDRDKTPSQIIQQFIYSTKMREIPIDQIDRFISKYIQK